MSNVTASTNITQVKPEDVPRYVDLALQDVVRVINGDLDFQTNINCKIIRVTFSAADTDQVIAHGLNRPPSGYIVAGSSVATNVYDGTSPVNATTIMLKASVAADVNLMFY